MATASTLKALKEEDNAPLPQHLAAVKPQRSGGLGDRFGTLWRSIWRRRWLSITTAWLICLIGWAAIALWPTSFMASAVIQADISQLASADASSGSGTAPPADLFKSLLLSDEGLLALQDDVKLDPAKSATIQQDLTLRSTAPPLFVATYSHESPEVAQQVLETLIQGFRNRRETSLGEAQQAIEALDEQIDRQKAVIQVAKADLDAFRTDNADYLDDAGNRAAELAILEEEVAGLEKQVNDTVVLRDDIAAELVKVRDVPAEARPGIDGPELNAQRATLEAELGKLRERYADTHPYVTAVFDAIEAIDSKIENQAANASAEVASNGGEIDREALEQRHGELIVGVATLNTRLEGKRREIELLETLTRTTSSVEADFRQLLAEKDALEGALTRLEQRREKLRGEEREEAGKDTFRLISKPELPSEPVGPSRLMALAAVLLGGVGLSAAAAVIRNRVTGVFESAWQLRKRFDVGVLGTISEVMTPAERRRLGYSRIGFALACFALIGAFSGLVFAELHGKLAPFGEHLRAQLLG
jgi:polysaccharide chain length determinant protein (PEP-CTERM system associated)